MTEKDDEEPKVIKRIVKAAVVEPKLKVNVIRTEGKSSLVEWHDAEADENKRAYVPKAEVSGGMCSKGVLDSGIPYGLPWASIIEIKMTPESLQKELHRIGIWTLDDFSAKGGQLFGAVNRSTGINLSNLHQAATEYLKKDG